jgi:hypothetical protein
METKENVKDTINSVINSTSITEEHLTVFLKLIDAPPSLEGIIEVTERFLLIFDYLNSVSRLEAIDDFLSEEQLENCKDVAELITSNINTITKDCPSSSARLLTKKPFHGLFVINPVYVCLGISSIDGNKSVRHLLLEAYIVYAAAILQARKEVKGLRSNSKQNPNALKEACLHARKLNLQPKSDSHRNLPDKLHSKPKEYLDSITNGGDLLKPLFNLLDYALNHKHVPTHSKKGTKRPLRRIHHSINDCVDPELLGRVDKVEMYQPVAKKASNRLDAPESTGGFDILEITEQPDAPTSGQTSDQHTRRKRYYLQSIAMHNQRLPHRWEMLNFHELSIYLEAIQQLANGSFYYKNYNSKIQLEIAAAGVTLFLCSLPIELLNTMLLNDAAYSQIAPPGFRYYHNNKTGCWIVCPPKLPIDMKLGTQFYASAERKREFFYISSGTGLEIIVDNYITTVRNNQSKNKELFLNWTFYYGRMLNGILSYLNQKHKTRLSLNSISSYLYHHLARTNGGDLTTAMLLTGKNDSLGMSPLHYTAYPVDKLQKMYHDSCSALMQAHLKETELRNSQEAPTTITSHVIAWNGTAGTAYRPRRRAVRKIVRRLQERMMFIKEMPRSLDKLLRLHNNMMRYTAILFAFSTGFRAVSSPLLPPSQIDKTTGFAVISDKDGIDYYNARIVWLPPVCVNQYHLYLEHLEYLLPKLEFLDIDAFNNLNDLLYYPLPSDRLPLFFFLQKDGHSTKIRPTDVWANIRSNLQYELPENASRHYLRSYLMEEGCPPEMIAAFMGHWERGEEPWGRYSALSPADYAETLAGYLVKLLENDGWKPVPGMQEYW